MRRFLAALTVCLVGSGTCRASGEAGILVRAGEWQNSIEQDAGQPPRVTLVCKKTDQTMTAATMAATMSRMAQCGTPTMNDDGSAITLVMSCDIGGGKMTTNSVITRDGPDAITTHTTSHMAGGTMQIPDMNMVGHSRRLGPCQPGDRPEHEQRGDAGH